MREAGKSLARGESDKACRHLSDLAKKIDQQEGKGELTAGEAAQLTAPVSAVSAELGCST